MKSAKLIAVFSAIISFFISALTFIKALTYELDAYDFGVFYRYLYTSIIFMLTTSILLVVLIVLAKSKNDNIKIEKNFVLIFAVVFIGFGSGYISSHYGNNVYYAKVVSNSSQTVDFEAPFELHKKYLPFYDKYTTSDKKGDYEIYKGDLKGTVMICADSDIIGQDYSMDYELEYLHTNNNLFYTKFLLQKTRFDSTSIFTYCEKNTYSVDGCDINIYKDGYTYAADIVSENEYMCVTVFNAREINEQEFIDGCIEQYNLMKNTVEADRLLVFD